MLYCAWGFCVLARQFFREAFLYSLKQLWQVGWDLEQCVSLQDLFRPTLVSHSVALTQPISQVIHSTGDY